MKTLKKSFTIILAVALMLAIIPLGTFNVSAATSGTTGGCIWTLDGSELTIVGNDGAMDNYSNSQSRPWGTTITKITIESGVTSIGNYAFYGCTRLTSVTIGNSVKRIGYDAFRYCTGLTSVTIPDSVTSISESAFRDCTGLTSVTIGNSVTKIGDYAFSDCKRLEKICYNAKSVADLKSYSDSYVFYNAGTSGNGIEVVFGNTVEKIPAYLFYVSDSSCRPKITNVTIGNSVTSIGSCAFYGCTGLTSIEIPDSVISIGGDAFYGCTGLTSVTIGNSVTSIGGFHGCTGLTSIEIPDSVISIGYSAFYGCTGLKSVTIGNSVTSIGGDAFRGCTGLTSIEIPDSVTNIGDYAFYDCYRLQTVTIGNSVTSIGESAFENCTGLKSVTIPDSVTSIGDWAFSDTAWYNNKPDGLVYAGKVAYAYKGTMPSNTSIVLKDGTLSITGYAFYGRTGLTSIEIPDSVTSIGKRAFYGCTGLTSVTIGNSVTKIGNYAFYGCLGLEKIYYNAKSVANFAESNETFYNAGRMGNGIEVIFGNTVEKIPAYLFYVHDSSYRPKITNVTIGNSVTNIGSRAFYCCTGLTSIEIPDSVINIGDYAFSGCFGLEKIYYNAKSVADLTGSSEVFYNAGASGNGTEVVFGNTVEKIPAYLFDSSKITSVTIGNSVKSIGKSAFYGCTGLTSVTIGNSVTSIGERAFSGCLGLEKIYYNAKSVADLTSSSEVFYNAGTSGNGIEVVFGDTVKKIPEYLFFVFNSSRRPKITNVTIGNSVTSIGYYAFYDCTGLTSVYYRGTQSQWGRINKGSCNDSLINANRYYICDIDGHKYDNDCDTTCNICGATRTITHQYKTVWSKDKTQHWHECSVCGLKKDTANHSYDNACDTTCNVCGYERSVGPHIYDNDCDTTCNICGETRTITHQYKTVWSKDKKQHWHECSVCGEKKDIANHNYDEHGVCSICGHIDYVPGDIDGKEGITDADAVYLLMHTFFPEDYPVDQPLDFNGDGNVTDADAIYLLMYTFFPEDYPI